jgi:hypothetical protein
LQQLVLPIQQVLRHHVVRRQTDLALAATVAERLAAGALEPLARAVIDPQIHRVTHQQAEHRATVEQSDAAEHAARQRIERGEQVQHERLELPAPPRHQVRLAAAACTMREARSMARKRSMAAISLRISGIPDAIAIALPERPITTPIAATTGANGPSAQA